VGVVAPVQDRAVGLQRQAEVAPRRDGDDAGQPDHLHRRAVLVAGAVAEPPVLFSVAMAQYRCAIIYLTHPRLLIRTPIQT